MESSESKKLAVSLREDKRKQIISSKQRQKRLLKCQEEIEFLKEFKRTLLEFVDQNFAA